MKKKSIVLYIILAILTILILFFSVKAYHFYSVSSKVEYFQTSDNSKDQKIGIYDDNYYKLNNDFFEANSADKKLFSFRVRDMIDVIYDNYIYVFYKTGQITIIDRNDAHQIKKTNIDSNIKKAKLEDNNIIVFGENSIHVLDKRLNIVNKIENLSNPVSYDSGNKHALIELKDINGVINSKISVFKNRENPSFQMNSTEETFLNVKYLGDKLFILSNRYYYLVKDDVIIKKDNVEKITAIDFSHNKLALVDNKKLKVYNDKFEEIEKIQIPKDVLRVSIRKNSIIMLSTDSIYVYENGNLLEEKAEDWIDSFSGKDAFYVIFKNQIHKVNAY